MKLRIKSKLILITFCIVSVSLVISGSFTYFYVTRIIREQSIADSQAKLSQNSFQIKRIQERTEKIAEYIISDKEIQLLLNKDNRLNLEQAYFRKKEIEERLKKFTVLNDFIMNILIVRTDGEMFSNNANYENYFEEYLQGGWFSELSSDGGKPQFSVPHPLYYGNAYQPAISYVSRYRNIENPEDDSTNLLILDIKYSEFKNAFQQSLGLYEQILLLNKVKAPLYNSNDKAPTLGTDSINQAIDTGNGYWEDQEHLIIYNNSMLEGWIQIAILSKAKLFAKINSILLFFVVVMISSLVLIFSVMTPIISRITRPISRMVSAMKRVSEGDLDMNISIRSGDELEILGSGFNRMVYELKEHVRSSIESEKLKRNMHIKLLTAQINPHFIYNTLNTVIYLSHASRNREAEQMTQALISILQDSIHTGDSSFFAKLEDEIRIVEKYLEIQKFRYPDRFHVEWSIHEELYRLVVPKMILQPIVENALFHGICSEYMEELGIIRIQAAQTDQGIEIVVEDNGKGITPEQLRVLSGTKTATGKRGIGLTNVRERIRYHYGMEHGIAIDSQPGKGTRVTMLLPFLGLATGFETK